MPPLAPSDKTAAWSGRRCLRTSPASPRPSSARGPRAVLPSHQRSFREWAPCQSAASMAWRGLTACVAGLWCYAATGAGSANGARAWSAQGVQQRSKTGGTFALPWPRPGGIHLASSLASPGACVSIPQVLPSPVSRTRPVLPIHPPAPQSRLSCPTRKRKCRPSERRRARAAFLRTAMRLQD
jgi:hypothetical protein